MDTNHEEATVENLSPGTKYIFKVRAVCKSDKGKENRGMESDPSDLIETNPISQPSKPIATSCTHNSITLEWSKPKVGFNLVEHYIVYYSMDGKSTQPLPHSMKIELQKRESVSIQHLKPSTSYQFQVFPVGDKGVGSLSEISEPIVTKSTGPPTKLRSYHLKVTHNSVHLQWESPEYGQEVIDHYQLFYKKIDNSGNWHKIDEKIVQTDYCVENLELNTEYVFKVLPICKDDQNKGTESELSTIKTKPTSPPGKPEAIKVTHNSVNLKWTKPTSGVPPNKYMVCYYVVSNSEQLWQDGKECTGETCEVKQLKPETKYRFVINPLCTNGGGTPSETSDEIITKPVCKPEKLKASNVTYKSITLTWSEPKYGRDQINYYIVQYTRTQSSEQKEECTKGEKYEIIIDELKDSTLYTFKVCAVLKHDVEFGIEYSDAIHVETKQSPFVIRLYKQAQSNCVPIYKGPPVVYELPRMTYTMRGEADKKMIAKCHFGEPELGIGKRERVLMLVGATGDGKSTLIECMVNNILGVKWEHDFRFQLIRKESERSDTESQTKFITAYTFYPVQGSTLKDYTLTIIDTPGYGDTRGIRHDQGLTQQIKEFFSTPPPQGIDHIDGVGFVTRAGSSRLTPTQRYIFDSILELFGEDMKNNIFLMITFCDAEKPKVLEAVSVADVPNVGYFTFNNSALYADNSDTGPTKIITSNFWKMGFDALQYFFSKFEEIQPVSLQLTKDVLDERAQLENLVEGLHSQITSSLDLIRELKQDKEAIIAASQILSGDRNNKPFSYVVQVMKGIKHDLPDEKKVTVCLTCNYTCHYPCTITDDELKYKCQAMKGILSFRKNTDAHCERCPGKCHWSKHANKPYLYVRTQVEENRTLEDLITKYSNPTSSEQQPATEDMLDGVAKRVKETCDMVLKLIKQTRESIHKLDRIALRKSDPTRETSSQVAYIELLIEAEKKGEKDGYEQRIEALILLRRRAQVADELTRSHRASN